jgi:hypothetical protein
MTAHELSRGLRDGAGDFLGHRRVAASLALLGMASLAAISLYQMGIFKLLPEPSISVLDAGKVNGSAGAYRCPNLCGIVLNSFVTSLKGLTYNAGDRYEVVVVSIDPRDTPATSALKKLGYLSILQNGEQVCPAPCPTHPLNRLRPKVSLRRVHTHWLIDKS